ncbi:class I SAM-dependent methyltransferase [Hoeflea sp. WL0058]|uniref:Class I SAM-dependent methyltransferase n=1 Tax=Flavimaribacter sediminis TaxID=2865987 RepID=A0AAE2ZLU0_9HYPH|nr:class I SAM-dependent methyltransferase [Flavimaribacter sediminis]MBW8638898.1 class I SAM-dependent methyltransferase [Flavimaribacter sediminis]
MWDERYNRPDYVFGTEPNAFLASQAELLSPGQSVLAVADGEGRNSVWLASQGLDVTAFDASSVGLDKAWRLAADQGVTVDYKLASIEDWDWAPDRFDIVAAIFIQFAPPDLRARIFDGIKQTVKPGGLVLMQGYRPEQVDYGTGGPPQRDHMYTRDLLENAFDDFEIMSLEAHDSEINEGPGHDGVSALIDMVARKPAG